MTKRMARWSALVSADAQVWWTFCGAFAVQFCTVDLQGAPQCVVAAVLKMLLNGWCTSRRFSESESLCKFGCGQKADCIEHYIQCAVVQRIWRELFRKEWGACEDRPAIGCSDPLERMQRGYFLYGIFMLYNFLRHASSVVDFVEYRKRCRLVGRQD